jgi:hypothetical protein
MRFLSLVQLVLSHGERTVNHSQIALQAVIQLHNCKHSVTSYGVTTLLLAVTSCQSSTLWLVPLRVERITLGKIPAMTVPISLGKQSSKS